MNDLLFGYLMYNVLLAVVTVFTMITIDEYTLNHFLGRLNVVGTIIAVLLYLPWLIMVFAVFGIGWLLGKLILKKEE
jgi:hypothetical protein